MLKEKAGVIAGNIWNALNETEGLGWLLREDKVSAEEVEGELFIKLI